MKENKIFINNFYEQAAAFRVTSDNSAETHKMVTGLHPQIEDNLAKRIIVSEIFKGLLLHDKIVFSTINLLNIIDAFGIKDTIKLLKTNKFELVDDSGFTLVLREELNKTYSLTDLQNSGNGGEIKDGIQWIEKRLWHKKKNNDELKILLLNAEKCNNLINVNSIRKNMVVSHSLCKRV
jgi:hypothetical protein